MRKILAIDGGGIRGIIPAALLAEIETRTGKPACEMFDLIAGTSTGGIIALGVTCRKPGSQRVYSAQDMLDLYATSGGAIFVQTLWSKLKSGFGLWGDRYDNSGLRVALEHYFGAARLKDAAAEVIVPAYEIERRQPYFFKRSKARTEINGDFLITAVALATSAAPTYFNPARLPTVANGCLYCVDGGLFANNPAADALAEARKLWPSEDYLVVSLGTGRTASRIPYDKASGWGAAKWLAPLLDILFDATAIDTDYRLSKELPADRYFRLQVQLPEELSAMSDASASNIEALKSVAGALVEAEAPRIAELCGML